MENSTKRLIGIFVPSQRTQRTLELLRTMRLKFNGLRLIKANGVVGIPLIKAPSAQEQNMLALELGAFDIQDAVFEISRAKPRTIREAIREAMPSHLVSQLPRSFDIVGDIAVIDLPSILEPYSRDIGKSILQVNPQVRLILRKSGDVAGVFRTRGLQPVYGSGGTETVHREFGCSYLLDVSAVYFNPRLAHERRRIATQVTRGEVVVDMFAGIGPYSILVAKLEPHSRVYAIDINPTATKYLKENILTNEVADRVTPLSGDAREFAKSKLHGVADRVIMNLPSEAEHFLDAAVRIIKGNGGTVHYYQFAPRGTDLASVKQQFTSSVKAQEWSVESFDYCEAIKEIGPNKVQVAVDAVIRRI